MVPEKHIKGFGTNKKLTPLHNLHSCLPIHLIEVLPQLHSLTGCDTTSKIGTKPAAIKNQMFFSDIKDFGIKDLNVDLILKAENFLIHALSPKVNCSTFDQLRCNEYLKYNRKVDFAKLPCTSASIHLHIQRAYLQCNRWIGAPHGRASLDPDQYGYFQNDNGQRLPQLTAVAQKPSSLPEPCTCKACARDKSCVCRRFQMACCKYCKCNADACKNPH